MPTNLMNTVRSDVGLNPGSGWSTGGRQIRPYQVGIASADDRIEISRLRYHVYAREIGQHPLNDQQQLTDALDEHNVMLLVRYRGRVAGFVSITPPTAPSFSIDKYFQRENLPFRFHDRLFEVRLLTVIREVRGGETAALLLYAAFRWVEAHQGTHVVAIGRREILSVYLRIGLQLQGLSTQSGSVVYELLHADLSHLRKQLSQFDGFVDRLRSVTDWTLPFAFDVPAPCFHGGAFFEAIGERFDHLQRSAEIINADVLDAWYPPAPAVLSAVSEQLSWLARTSPPTRCRGLIETIAQVRGVAPCNILAGAGSSDLIFRVLPRWLNRDSRVLILEPMYGEYAHVLESVIGCRVERLKLSEESHFQVPLDELIVRARQDVDLVILVNPNSPTGQHVSREELEATLRCFPESVRVWVDETYVEYAGSEQSLEKFAAQSHNVVVCKSMSKIYALSGMRVAYLCGGPHLLESLHPVTPPWVVGLPAQLAAVRAMESEQYYAEMIQQTHELRENLSRHLELLGWHVIPGIANFLLCRLPDSGPDTDGLIAAAQRYGLFLRNPAPSGSAAGTRWIRVAVKDAATNDRLLTILRTILQDCIDFEC